MRDFANQLPKIPQLNLRFEHAGTSGDVSPAERLPARRSDAITRVPSAASPPRLVAPRLDQARKPSIAAPQPDTNREQPDREKRQSTEDQRQEYGVSVDYEPAIHKHAR